MAGGPSRRRRRLVPPLALALVALLLAAVVVPSVLSSSRSELDTPVAFAPVPPDREPVDPPAAPPALAAPSDLGEVADGDGGTGGSGDGPDTGPSLAPREGTGSNPAHACVKDAAGFLRQTADPMSPPCTLPFDGDNFGATGPGITRDEVRLVIRVDTGGQVCQRAVPCTVDPGLHDLSAPLDKDVQATSRQYVLSELRAFVRHFEERYELYGRRLRVFAHVVPFGRTRSHYAAAARRAIADVTPFAVLARPNNAWAFDAHRGYTDEPLSRGIPVLALPPYTGAAELARHPGRAWSFFPTRERMAELFADFTCNQVVGHTTSFVGDVDGSPGAPDTGRPRRYAVLRVGDPSSSALRALGEEAQRELEARCLGGDDGSSGIVDVETIDSCCFTEGNRAEPRREAVEAVRRWQAAGVTTVLWLGGSVGDYPRAAGQLGYEPEWVVLGDDVLDGWEFPQLGQLNEYWDGRAVVLSPRLDGPGPLQDAPEVDEDSCAEVILADNPNEGMQEAMDACEYFGALRLAVTAIQSAGPLLTPTTVERGLRAIRWDHIGPRAASCAFQPGTFDCLDDVQVQVLDPVTFPHGHEGAGCWRSLDGRRHGLGDFPRRDIGAQVRDRAATWGDCNPWAGESYIGL